MSELDSTLVAEKEISLNYSREDLAVLLNEAERLVLGQTWAHTGGESSDSDYETHASRDWLVSSEPNIPLRRLSPSRKSRRDWRNSLPECLEFYNNTDGRDSRLSQVSLPLSDLWELDTALSEKFQDGANEHEAAALPASLANFGEDYHKFLYSDITDSDTSDLEGENSRERHFNTNYQILQSKSSLRDLLIQLNTNKELWKSYNDLEEIDEVCQKNVSILRDQRKQTDLKHQLRSFDRLICKWEDVGADIRQGLKQHSELRNISEKLAVMTGDIATLNSIISDDHEDQVEEDDDELADIMHQLFEQAKSHLLEISDSLFQLNISLTSLRTVLYPQFPLHKLDVAEVESELGQLYRAWQSAHLKVTQAEKRYEESEVSRHREEFSDLVSQRLTRLARTQQYIDHNNHPDHSEPPSTFRRILRFGLVSSVMLASFLSVTYLWSYNKCQNNYYNQIWPVLSFSAGPRPF